MRVIYENVDNEYFLELVLTDEEIENISNKGVIGDYLYNNGKDTLNVYIRRE